jgi:hypothetical protein
MSPSGSHDPDNVLADLRGIMQQAGEQYYSEQRLDVSNEVADSVRFVQASMLWQERITPHVQLKFHLAHDYLPVVEGHVLWVSRRFLCVRGGQHEFLINLEHIVAVTGLPSVGLAVTSSAVIDQMESIWLGGVLEDQQLASWYVSLDQVFVGACTRLGMDAVDVQTDRLSVTVMFKYVVAVRIALQG